MRKLLLSGTALTLTLWMAPAQAGSCTLSTNPVALFTCSGDVSTGEIIALGRADVEIEPGFNHDAPLIVLELPRVGAPPAPPLDIEAQDIEIRALDPADFFFGFEVSGRLLEVLTPDGSFFSEVGATSALLIDRQTSSLSFTGSGIIESAATPGPIAEFRAFGGDVDVTFSGTIASTDPQVLAAIVAGARDEARLSFSGVTDGALSSSSVSSDAFLFVTDSEIRSGPSRLAIDVRSGGGLAQADVSSSDVYGNAGVQSGAFGVGSGSLSVDSSTVFGGVFAQSDAGSEISVLNSTVSEGIFAITRSSGQTAISMMNSAITGGRVEALGESDASVHVDISGSTASGQIRASGVFSPAVSPQDPNLFPLGVSLVMDDSAALNGVSLTSSGREVLVSGQISNSEIEGFVLGSTDIGRVVLEFTDSVLSPGVAAVATEGEVDLSFADTTIGGVIVASAPLADVRMINSSASTVDLRPSVSSAVANANIEMEASAISGSLTSEGTDVALSMDSASRISSGVELLDGVATITVSSGSLIEMGDGSAVPTIALRDASGASRIVNSGRIVGAISNASAGGGSIENLGDWIASGGLLNISEGFSDIYNAGVMRIALLNAGGSVIDGVSLSSGGSFRNAGLVTMQNGVAGDVFEIDGDFEGVAGGVISIDVDFSTFTADTILISGVVSGDPTAIVVVDMTGAVGVDPFSTPIPVIKVADGVGAQEDFFLANGSVRVEAFVYNLELSDVDGPGGPERAWRLVAVDEGAPVAEALPAMALNFFGICGREDRAHRQLSDDVRSWAAICGGRSAYSALGRLTSYDVDERSTGVSLGLEMDMGDFDAGTLTGHLGFTSVQGTASVTSATTRGLIESEGMGLVAGLTWTGRSGFFVEGEVAALSFSSTLTGVDGEVDGFGRSFRLEVGQRFELENDWYVTPSLELRHSMVSLDGFTTPDGQAVAASRNERSSARIAAEVGRSWTTDAGGDARIFGIAGYSRDFGDTSIGLSGNELTRSSNRERIELGIGGSYTFDGGNTAIHGSITSGRSLSGGGHDTRASLGIIFRF